MRQFNFCGGATLFFIKFQSVAMRTFHNTDKNRLPQTKIISWFVLESMVISEHGVVFYADLLFLVYVFQQLSDYRFHSDENEAGPKLQ